MVIISLQTEYEIFEDLFRGIELLNKTEKNWH